jgi:hypothetical protein
MLHRCNSLCHRLGLRSLEGASVVAESFSASAVIDDVPEHNIVYCVSAFCNQIIEGEKNYNKTYFCARCIKFCHFMVE